MEIFKAHLDKFIRISNEEFALISAYFQVLEVKKKEDLMLEGEFCKLNILSQRAVCESISSMRREWSRPLNLLLKTGG